MSMDVVRPGSVFSLNYTFNTATRRNTSETYAHSLPVVTADTCAVVAEAGIVIGRSRDICSVSAGCPTRECHGRAAVVVATVQ